MKQGHAHKVVGKEAGWKAKTASASKQPGGARHQQAPALVTEPTPQGASTAPEEGGMKLWGRCGYVPASKAHEP